MFQWLEGRDCPIFWSRWIMLVLYLQWTTLQFKTNSTSGKVWWWFSDVVELHNVHIRALENYVELKEEWISINTRKSYKEICSTLWWLMTLILCIWFFSMTMIPNMQQQMFVNGWNSKSFMFLYGLHSLMT
jgi:hypothetical protein